MAIYLTAIIKSKTEHTEEVKALLLNMMQQSVKEKACLQYDLHQGLQDAGVFIFHEIWESEAGLTLHNEQPYIQAFRTGVPMLLAEPPVIYRTVLL